MANVKLRMGFVYTLYTSVAKWFNTADDITDDNAGSLSRAVNLKRPEKDVLRWDEFFMGTAFLAGMRSKDPVTQVGACIVSADKKIVGTGYNGMPNNCSDDVFPWDKNTPSALDNKHTYVCHAELNAILNTSTDLKDCTIYVGLFPCNECAKVIIQSGIKKVIYYSDKQNTKETNKAAKKMFDAANVKYEQCKLRKEEIIIDFSKINSTANLKTDPDPDKP